MIQPRVKTVLLSPVVYLVIIGDSDSSEVRSNRTRTIMSKIEIIYDGDWPNLCSGKLIVVINGVIWMFPEHCLVSGGCVWFDDDWNSYINEGDWDVGKWPDYFPEHLKEEVIESINCNITRGCCGGCI